MVLMSVETDQMSQTPARKLAQLSPVSDDLTYAKHCAMLFVVTNDGLNSTPSVIT